MRFFKVLILLFAFLVSFETSAGVSTLVADTKSGLILSAQNAAEQKHPASLTKVMTLYLTFTALENGLLSMDDKLPVSLHAAKQPRSKLYVKAGQTISVRDAIMALIIISANDVAVVLSEALAPSEAEFAKMMTDVAHNLGLKNTTFKNASGLHHPDQVTTAQDMAVLAMAMIHHFPNYYKLFSKKTFTYKGKTYNTHNHVQKKYAGAEGLKTGYISAVGYNIISTAKRDNHRLVSVVIGQDTIALRDKQAMNLLDKGFAKIKKQVNIFKRLKKPDSESALNKQAVLKKPNMTPYLKIMATRLNKLVKTGSSANRRRLMALAPQETPKDVVVESPLIAQGDIEDTIAKEKQATKQEENITKEAVQTEDQPALNNTPAVETSEVETSEEAPKKIEETPQEVSSAETSSKSEENTKEEKETLAETSSQEEQMRINALAPSTHSDPKQTEVQEEDLKKEETPVHNLQQRKNSWGIQVGAFASQDAATKMAQKALKIVGSSGRDILIPKKDNFYRSRIFGFSSKKQAKQACQKLKAHKMQCLELSPAN